MKILFLTHRLPYAPNRGDRIRAFYLLREMSRFAEVSLFSLVHDDEEATHISSVPFAHTVTTSRVTKIRNYLRGAASLASNRPLTHSLLDAPDVPEALDTQLRVFKPDVVVAYCSSMARFAVEPPLDKLPFVLDMVDVDSVKWAELAARTRLPMRWLYRREARTLAAFEADAVRRSKLTLVVNKREETELSRLAPDSRIVVMENGIDTAAFHPGPSPTEAPNVVFCGVMDYAPNAEGVEWFVRNVWPAVLAAKPTARLTVVGPNPSASLRQLAAANPSISVAGRVPDVQPYLAEAAVSIAPLHLARGLQNKVLEALASGLPVVATSAVMNGLPSEVKPGCVQADADDDFAAGVIDLLSLGAEARRDRARRARLEELGWSTRLAPLESLVTRIAGTRLLGKEQT